MTHKQITFKGKVYGYWIDANGKLTTGIRSESNPNKTPYLKQGSKTYSEVRAAIEAQEAA